MAPMFYVLIFMAVVLAVEGIASLMSERRTGARATARKRLRQIALGIQNPDVQSEESILRARQDVRKKLLDLSRLVPGGVELERRLYQAGLTITSGQFALLCVAFGLGAWLVASIIFYSPSVAFPFVLAGFLPFVHVGRKRSQRMFKFEEQFPEALDLITRALRAGHAFTTGLEMVANEMPSPVREEFRLLYDQQNYGMSMPDALKVFATRIPVLDARFFVTAVLIQREAGGNLAEVLDNLSGVIRDRFKVKRQMRVVSAHGRITGWVLVCLPPVLGLTLMTINPEARQLMFGEKLGIQMMIGAAVLQSIGALIIRKIINVPY